MAGWIEVSFAGDVDTLTDRGLVAIDTSLGLLFSALGTEFGAAFRRGEVVVVPDREEHPTGPNDARRLDQLRVRWRVLPAGEGPRPFTADPHPELDRAVARLDRVLQAGPPGATELLSAPPALASDVVRAEALLGRPLPDDYRAWLSRHGHVQGFLAGWEVCPIREAARTWSFLGQHAPQWGEWRAAWFPFAADGAGNHLCIDLEGGGVVTWYHDDGDRPPVAASFAGWLADRAEMLASGELVFLESADGRFDGTLAAADVTGSRPPVRVWGEPEDARRARFQVAGRPHQRAYSALLHLSRWRKLANAAGGPPDRDLSSLAIVPLLTSEAPEPSPEWLRSRLDELGHRTTATDDELRDLFDRLSTGRPLPRPNPLRTAATLLASGLVSRLQDLGLLRTDRLGRLAVDRAVRSALEPLVPEDAPPDVRPDEAKIARWAEAASAALERVREDVTLEVLEVPDLAPLLRELVAPDHGR